MCHITANLQNSPQIIHTSAPNFCRPVPNLCHVWFRSLCFLWLRLCNLTDFRTFVKYDSEAFVLSDWFMLLMLLTVPRHKLKCACGTVYFFCILLRVQIGWSALGLSCGACSERLAGVFASRGAMTAMLLRGRVIHSVADTAFRGRVGNGYIL